jgi:hypothetical protein
MALKINLLKKTRILSEAQYKLESRIFLGSLSVLGIILLLAMGLFSWQYFVSARLNNLENRIAQANGQLKGLETANVQQLYIKSRLQLVSSFLESRAETREALQRVFAIPIDGVNVSAINFETEQVLAMQMSANSIVSFDKAYEFLENDRDFFRQIVNKGVSRGQDGVYIISLELTLPTKKIQGL